MGTSRIPKEQWGTFFESFSSRHRGWLVTVEVLSPEFGDQVEVRNLPLEGITAELDHPGDEMLEIAAGIRRDQHVTKSISDPQEVWLKQTEEGADEAIEIEGKTDKVLVRFRSPALTELVDGL